MRRREIKRRLTAGIVLAAAFLPGAAGADIFRSIKTDFVEVLVEGVPLGARYVMEAKPVEVINASGFEMGVRYEALEPTPAELRAGYEPVPDPAWISFEPRSFSLTPGGKASGKIVLYIPDDPKLVGRRFQATLRLGTDPGRGVVSVGLRPRFLFSIQGRGKRQGEPKLVNLPPVFARIQPYEIASNKAVISVDLAAVLAENPWPEEMTYEYAPDPKSMGKIQIGPAETPIPDLSWVEVRPQVLVLGPTKNGEFSLTARIPVAPEHFGKYYVMPFHAVARRKGAKDVHVYNKIRVVVPELAFSVTASGKKK